MTGTNAESFSAPSFMTPFSLARRSRLIHLCNRFAFTPCESARLAIHTPGCKHASTRRLSACGSNIRLPSRFTLIIGSPSHTYSSMSEGVHCQLGGHPYSASTLQCARCRKLSAYVSLMRRNCSFRICLFDLLAIEPEQGSMELPYPVA